MDVIKSGSLISFGHFHPISFHRLNHQFRHQSILQNLLKLWLMAALIAANPVHAASLIASNTAAPGTVDLTIDGGADWAHWGRTKVTDLDRKVGVTPQISNYSLVGGLAPSRYQPPAGIRVQYSWSDGTPVASANTNAGVYFQGIGNGYQLTVPAAAAPRTLKVYLGAWQARGRVDVSLSDGSAVPYSTLVDNPTGAIDRVISIDFSATTGQSLVFRYVIEDNYGLGNITLAAASLGGTSNQAPTLNPVGDQSATEGQLLNFAVSATDDGPAPLTLSASTLPGSAIFTDNGAGKGTFNWTPVAADVVGSPYSITVTATDGAGLFSRETFRIFVAAAPTGGGMLTVTSNVAPSSVNLTTEGSADWAHWGRTKVTDLDRKVGVTPQISNYSLVGGLAPSRYQPPAGIRVQYSWSDGTPVASANTNAGVYFQGIGNGYQLTVPAAAAPRTLKVYLGAWQARGRVDVSLSDGSAVPYSTLVDNPTGAIDRVISIDFSATTGQSLVFRYVIEDNYGSGNITLAAATLVESVPAISLPYTEDFNDLVAQNWTTADETNPSGNWSAGGGAYLQNVRVESTASFDGSYHLGTYSYLQSGLTLTDYVYRASARYDGQGLADDVGVVFRFKDLNNFYRVSLNSRFGFTRLEKKQAGLFSTLAVNARGYLPGQWLDFEIAAQGANLTIKINGDHIFAVNDAALISGTVGLYSQDHATFDNVSIQAPDATPSVTIGSPLAYSVTSNSNLAVTATIFNFPTSGSIEFVLDGSTMLPGNLVSGKTYRADFIGVAAGDHTVEAIVYNALAVESGRDTNQYVGARGDHFIAVGDSITNGSGDTYALDNITLDPRGLGFQGYEANLAALLNTTRSTPSIIYNEGIGGDESVDTDLTRLASIMERHGNAPNHALIMLGTNDSGSLIPSGSGCSAAGCNGTYKGNMQSIVDRLNAKGILPWVALAPPAFGSSSGGAPFTAPASAGRNVNYIKTYNNVVVTELTNRNIGPDFYTYFLGGGENRFSLFADNLHPNSLGYKVMAQMWHNAITPSAAPMPFTLHNLSPSTSAPYLKQNILETGDKYYVDESFTVNSIPAVVANGVWIMGANADKTKNTATYLSFSVDVPVTVYIGYDAGASSLPTWMSTSGYVNAGINLTTTDPLSPVLALYSAHYASGTVALGGNLEGAAVGADSNYIVVIVPQ